MMSSSILFVCLLVTFVRATVPTIEGFTVTWSDDFTGTRGSLPSSSNWQVDVGTSYPGGAANWGTGEIQTYTNNPDNLAVSGNSTLEITALRDSAGAWTSGRIETVRQDFQAAAGEKMRIQASISMPDITGTEALGYWPAFWTLGGAFRGNYQNWPSVGEYDIMENVNGISKVWGVLHCDVNPGGACNETDGIAANIACPGSACQGNFHTYTLEVDRSSSPEALRWLVDGTEFHTINPTDVGDAVWAQTVHNGQFILINLAMGGAFPNNQHGSATPLSTTVPGASLLVDYVAVYNS